MKIKQAIALMLLICAGEVSAGGNVYPWLTFGDMPVVGVLLVDIGSSDGALLTEYGAGNVVVDGDGVRCPPNTAEISVRGFDFTPYNGWNGIYIDSGCNPFGGCRSRPLRVSTLCVTPRA
jgi:hypothetical protein